MALDWATQGLDLSLPELTVTHSSATWPLGQAVTPGYSEFLGWLSWGI